MQPLPFIEIQITYTLEKDLSKKEILQTVKERFEKTHQVPVKWTGNFANPKIRIEYPSITKFSECYRYGFPFFEKLHEILENEKTLSEFPIGKFIEKRDLDDSETMLSTYLILRYKTNSKEIMRKNYEYTWPISSFLQTEFYIEEIEDGFLMFYLDKDDFLIHQLDRMSGEEVEAWLVKKKVDMDNEGIKQILDFLKSQNK